MESPQKKLVTPFSFAVIGLIGGIGLVLAAVWSLDFSFDAKRPSEIWNWGTLAAMGLFGTFGALFGLFIDALVYHAVDNPSIRKRILIAGWLCVIGGWLFFCAWQIVFEQIRD